MSILEIEAVVVYQAQRWAFLFPCSLKKLHQHLGLSYLNVSAFLKETRRVRWALPWTCSTELCRLFSLKLPAATWALKPESCNFFLLLLVLSEILS